MLTRASTGDGRPIVNILFIGDIVGRPGRRAVANLVLELRERYRVDVCVANCENAAGGFGVTPEITGELLNLGIDVLTSGNHIWDRREIVDFISIEPRLVRPANYPQELPGHGVAVIRSPGGDMVGVINVSGRVFLDPLDCPFRAVDREIEAMQGAVSIVLVDFHAEATSEKMAMGRYLDGRVAAVIGSHTHVQTADETILPQGTAYITDVGMTGPTNSIIGMDNDVILERFLSGVPKRFEPAKGIGALSGVVVNADPETGLASGIERIHILSPM